MDSDEVDADWDVGHAGLLRGAADCRSRAAERSPTRDREGAPFVAIVNEAMAARLWPGRDPIGQRLLQRVGPSDSEERTLEVVGVTRTGKYRSIGEAPRNFIYVPLTQQYIGDNFFYVRRSPRRVAARRAAARRSRASIRICRSFTRKRSKEYTALGLLPQRLAAWIAASVGTIGLLLAALGLYGLTAFSVAQRTREMALRMALGARREAVLSLVLAQSGRLAAGGAVIGLALAVGVSMLLQSLLRRHQHDRSARVRRRHRGAASPSCSPRPGPPRAARHPWTRCGRCERSNVDLAQAAVEPREAVLRTCRTCSHQRTWRTYRTYRTYRTWNIRTHGDSPAFCSARAHLMHLAHPRERR